MLQTPFHSYYQARQLEQLSEDSFVSVFASSDIQIYPFQIAAASFALRSPYQRGAVLCDEAGMGKSHEAMLVITQKWLEGKSRILLVIPNVDLLYQWIEMLERYYTVPYVILTNRNDWQEIPLSCSSPVRPLRRTLWICMVLSGSLMRPCFQMRRSFWLVICAVQKIIPN